MVVGFILFFMILLILGMLYVSITAYLALKDVGNIENAVTCQDKCSLDLDEVSSAKRTLLICIILSIGIIIFFIGFLVYYFKQTKEIESVIKKYEKPEVKESDTEFLSENALKIYEQLNKKETFSPQGKSAAQILMKKSGVTPTTTTTSTSTTTPAPSISSPYSYPPRTSSYHF